jgi:hypothetical protein
MAARDKVFKQSEVNEFEVIRFRVDHPKNGRFFWNGYLLMRVAPGEETEIPRFHPMRDLDAEPQVQMTDSEGNLLYRENRVPRGCTFIEYADNTPRRPVSAKPEAGGTSKTKPKMRAADVPVGV